MPNAANWRHTRHFWADILAKAAPHADPTLIKMLAVVCARDVDPGSWLSVQEALQEAQFEARLDGRGTMAAELAELAAVLEFRHAIETSREYHSA